MNEYDTTPLLLDAIENLNKTLKKIASGVGWISLWTFLIFLSSCVTVT